MTCGPPPTLFTVSLGWFSYFYPLTAISYKVMCVWYVLLEPRPVSTVRDMKSTPKHKPVKYRCLIKKNNKIGTCTLPSICSDSYKPEDVV